MSSEKTKVVEVEGKRYQIGRLDAAVGSFILMRCMANIIKQASQQPEPSPDAPQAPLPERSAEEQIRSFVFGAFMSEDDIDRHRIVMMKCMGVVSTLTEDGAPIPVATTTDLMPELRNNIPLTMRLEVEVLAFNFADFFAAGGMRAVAGTQASKA